MEKLLDEVKNILFPRNICLFCKKQSKTYICGDCFEHLEVVNGEIDLHCPYIDQVYYSLFYNRLIRDKLADFKFNGQNYLARAFSEILVATIREKKIEDHIDIIFFIPSHRRREAKRGYNQGELLAKYIGKSLDKPVSRGNLVKLKKTKNQSSLNKVQRSRNLENAFVLRNKSEIKAKKILLVDDIVTTGATLKETSKVLLQGGSKSIIAISLTATKI